MKKKIELTLKSLSFVDEIVVILDRSIDDTKKIASKYTKKFMKVHGNLREKGEITVFLNAVHNGFWRSMQMN